MNDREIFKEYVENNDRVIFNKILDDVFQDNTIYCGGEPEYRISNFYNILLDSYLKNEKFKIDEEYIDIRIRVIEQNFGLLEFIFIEQYSVERDKFTVRLKVRYA